VLGEKIRNKSQLCYGNCQGKNAMYSKKLYQYQTHFRNKFHIDFVRSGVYTVGLRLNCLSCDTSYTSSRKHIAFQLHTPIS